MADPNKIRELKDLPATVESLVTQIDFKPEQLNLDHWIWVENNEMLGRFDNEKAVACLVAACMNLWVSESAVRDPTSTPIEVTLARDTIVRGNALRNRMIAMIDEYVLEHWPPPADDCCPLPMLGTVGFALDAYVTLCMKKAMAGKRLLPIGHFGIVQAGMRQAFATALDGIADGLMHASWARGLAASRQRIY